MMNDLDDFYRFRVAFLCGCIAALLYAIVHGYFAITDQLASQEIFATALWHENETLRVKLHDLKTSGERE